MHSIHHIIELITRINCINFCIITVNRRNEWWIIVNRFRWWNPDLGAWWTALDFRYHYRYNMCTIGWGFATKWRYQWWTSIGEWHNNHWKSICHHRTMETRWANAWQQNENIENLEGMGTNEIRGKSVHPYWLPIKFTLDGLSFNEIKISWEKNWTTELTQQGNSIKLQILLTQIIAVRTISSVFVWKYQNEILSMNKDMHFSFFSTHTHTHTNKKCAKYSFHSNGVMLTRKSSRRFFFCSFFLFRPLSFSLLNFCNWFYWLIVFVERRPNLSYYSFNSLLLFAYFTCVPST